MVLPFCPLGTDVPWWGLFEIRPNECRRKALRGIIGSGLGLGYMTRGPNALMALAWLPVSLLGPSLFISSIRDVHVIR
jgi:hypothetical protein